MQILTSVGQKLRKLREKKGLTISEVADMLNKSSSQIGSIERADRCPSLTSLIELAEFYQVPLAYLFEDDLVQFQQQVGNFIQTILIQKELTIADLSRKTEINYFQLAEFFQGRGSLSVDQLKRIAQTLDLSIKEIIPETVRYVRLIEYYLGALGIDEISIQNIVEYIYSKFDV